jgi:hypothetical protein
MHQSLPFVSLHVIREVLPKEVMSPELVAALVGAVVGGIIAVLGGIAQVFIQGWISERGDITCDATAKELAFSVRQADTYKFIYSLKDAKAFFNENAASADWEKSYFTYAFTANFLNTKGTNTAAMEYSVRFLKGKRIVATSVPNAKIGDIELATEQALALPAENATGFLMKGNFYDANAAKKALIEADRLEFTVRLSTDKIIGVELDRLP